MGQSNPALLADIAVRLLEPGDAPAVDAFLAAHDRALFYHCGAFRRLLADVTGAEDVSLGVWRARRLEGVLPAMIRNGRFGAVLNALPFYGSNGAPVASDEGAEAALWNGLVAMAEDRDLAAATVIENPLQPTVFYSPLTSDAVTDRRMGFVTPLGALENADTLWSAIDGSARRNVRKAQREGVSVASGDEGWDFLESVHRENMTRIGVPPKPAEFFDAARRRLTYGDDYRLYTARINGESAAALLVFYGSETVEYYMPAIHHDYRAAQPLAAIIWQAMQDALAEGILHWNWGGSPLNHIDLQRFKRKWAGRSAEYRYFCLVRNPDILSSSPDTLARDYPHFFTVPFALLKNARKDTS